MQIKFQLPTILSSHNHCQTLTMQGASTYRKLSRVLNSPFLIKPQRLLFSCAEQHHLDQSPSSTTSHQWQNHRSFSSKLFHLQGPSYGTRSLEIANAQNLRLYQMIQRASFAAEAEAEAEAEAVKEAEATASDGGPTEAVKVVYDKMLKSLEGRTMPPNAWMWSLIEKCAKREDIALLFQMLQKLRTFRLSNLRIHTNFNPTLCLRIAEACTRVGAIDFGKKVLWEHNVYGLTPTTGSANCLLLYAKKHNDAKLMLKIMELLKKNHLPLQPSTADIVFSICYHTDNWELLSKYAKKFTKAGVKLRRTTFGTWMEFAAKRGDVESLWKIEKQRSDLMEKHNFATAFSCAKGFLLESKSESAVAVIHLLNENLADANRPGILVELQKLVSEWPVEVVKHQKEGDRKALASSLKNNITALVDGLLNMGLEAKVSLDDLNRSEAIPC